MQIREFVKAVPLLKVLKVFCFTGEINKFDDDMVCVFKNQSVGIVEMLFSFDLYQRIEGIEQISKALEQT